MASSNQKQDSVPAQQQVIRLQKVVDRLKLLTEKYRQAEVVQQALFRISELASSAGSMNQLYSSLHEIVGELMEAKNFYICLYSADQKQIQFPYFVDEFDRAEAIDEVPTELLNRGMTGYLLRSQEPQLLTRDDIERLNNQGAIDAHGSIPLDWLGVPLVDGDSIIGAMVVQSYSEQVRYQEDDLDLLMFVSQHVVNALSRFKHREWMENEISRRTRELRLTNNNLREEINEREKAERQNEVLYEISELSSSTRDMSAFYRALHEAIQKLIVAENFYIALYDSAKQQLHFPYFVDEISHFAHPRRFQRGSTEYVIRLGKPALLDDQRRQELVAQGEIITSEGSGRLAKQWLGVPLRLEQEVIGVLAVQVYDGPRIYTEDDLELLNFVGQHVAVAIERRRAATELERANTTLERRIDERTEELVAEIERRKQIEAQLYHDAHHDNLTGLPNRAMFTDRLKQTVARYKRLTEGNFALLFLDLDRFKNINDTLGHSAGDVFLQQVADRILKTVRDHDLLARFGGDEFVVLLDPITHLDDARDVAERLLQNLAKPFELGGKPHYSGASIGIRVSHGEQDSVDKLLQDADAAMYEAKSLGRGRYVVFDESIRSGLVASLTQESLFHRARENQEYRLWRDPVVHLNTRAIRAWEYQVRWQDGPEQVFSPAYMKLAERSGAIIELDQWLLTQAIQQPLRPSEERLYVQISAQHLLRPRHLNKLQEIVAAGQVELGQIFLEFSESHLLREDEKRVMAGLRVLNEAGLGLCLKNFGRKSGPLHFIYNFPFQVLKLDQNFVTHVSEKQRARAMLRHVATLCHELSIELHAQGLESEELTSAVQALGVTYGQGGCLGEPEPVTADYSQQAVGSHT